MKDSGNKLHSGGSFGDAPSITASLLTRLKARDPEGWSRLSRLYCPLVYRWCLRARLQPQDASDIVQEVFRTVAMKIDGFRRDREGDTFRGWLWTITRNKLGDYIRKQKNGAHATGGSDAMAMMMQVPENLEDADSIVDSSDFSELYRRALDMIRQEFEERTWTAFWQAVIEDKPAAVVAEELGMSQNAVYIAKSRILARLRQELGDRD